MPGCSCHPEIDSPYYPEPDFDQPDDLGIDPESADTFTITVPVGVSFTLTVG